MLIVKIIFKVLKFYIKYYFCYAGSIDVQSCIGIAAVAIVMSTFLCEAFGLIWHVTMYPHH